MEATKSLPENYRPYKTLDLSTNKTAMIFLNIAGAGLFFLFGWIFLRLAIVLHPSGFSGNIFPGTLAVILEILAAYVVVITIHELVHGMFFWLITHERPKFGFKVIYAYAAAPDWYLPRNPYLIIGLAPLVLISLAGILAIPYVSASNLIVLLFALTINASGAVGDMVTIAWVLTQPRDSLVRDEGDAFTIYQSIPLELR
jgi:hypothetical protein